jgi:hypothetical protein
MENFCFPTENKGFQPSPLFLKLMRLTAIALWEKFFKSQNHYETRVLDTEIRSGE